MAEKKSDTVLKFEKMQELMAGAEKRRIEIGKLIRAYNDEKGIEMATTSVNLLAKDLLLYGTIEGMLRAQEGDKNGKKRTTKS